VVQLRADRPAHPRAGEPESPRAREPESKDAAVKKFKVGPVTVEATSVNAARRAEPRLF
jgi:hypothetical protein